MPYKDKEKEKACRQRNRAARLIRNRKYWANLSDARKKAAVLARYGATVGQFEIMIQAQLGLCAICREVMNPACIDHDHVTGKVRGLLCHSCNRGIGLLKDSAVVIANALIYLQERS